MDVNFNTKPEELIQPKNYNNKLSSFTSIDSMETDTNTIDDSAEDDILFREVTTFAVRENCRLLEAYGIDTYNQNKNNKLITIFPPNYLQKNNISSKKGKLFI